MSSNTKKAKGIKHAAKKNKKKQGSDRKGTLYSAPLTQGRLIQTYGPQVSGSMYTGDGRVRVKHREYIADVAGSVAFATTTFNINPGLAALFTWLAPVAGQFESYLFASLSFEFETQKSASTSGSVMMAVDFDASDSAPVNKQQLMSYHNAVRSGVWQENCYRADRKDLQKFGVQRYIRQGSAGNDQDIKTYDVGNLFIATQGCADTTAIGELYVTYDIELITPQNDMLGSILAASKTFTGAGSVTRAAPFGTAATNTGQLPASAVSATLTFSKVGRYLINSFITGTVVTDVAPTLTGTATSAAVSIMGHNTAATNGIFVCSVTVNNVGETVIFDWTASATTITATITQIATFQQS